MKRLTKRLALQICWELWSWLAENPGKDKGNWPGWKGCDNEFKVPYGYIEVWCPCCTYSYRSVNNFCHKQCLIKWPGDYCMDKNSWWHLWNITSHTSPKRTEYALQIANAAKAELDKLPKIKRG